MSFTTYPEEIKIITFSNSYLAPLLNPSLTTITQPAYEMGKEAATILFKIIEKKGHHFLLEKTILNSKLVERNSTKGKPQVALCREPRKYSTGIRSANLKNLID